MGKILGYAVALALLGGAWAGVGTASATMPSMVGKTYSEASGALSKWHISYEVATTLGTELPRNDCVVVNQVLRPPSRFGALNTPAKLLLSLDCTAAVASATEAGNSAASPEGHAALKAAAQEKWLHDNPDVCVKMKAAHPDWFKTPLKGCEGVV